MNCGQYFFWSARCLFTAQKYFLKQEQDLDLKHFNFSNCFLNSCFFLQTSTRFKLPLGSLKFECMFALRMSGESYKRLVSFRYKSEDLYDSPPIGTFRMEF